MPRGIVRWTLCCIFLNCALVPSRAGAEGLQHSWSLAKEAALGHVLIPDGEAEGKGVIALILPEKPVGDASIPEAFDAAIEYHLQNATNIRDRVDFPRKPLLGGYLLRTFLRYQTAKGDARIAIFIATAKQGDETLRIIRANGPDDSKLMLHYEQDVSEIARHPDDAIAEKIGTRPHEALTSDTPVAKAAPEPPLPTAAAIRPEADLVRPANSVWHGNVWGFRSFDRAVRWWVRDFNNTLGYSSYSITLHDPKPLNGKSVSEWLVAEAAAEEKHFQKTLQRDEVKTWQPLWFGLYKAYENNSGDQFGAEYNAVQVGPDSARMVRFLMSERGFYKKEFTNQNDAVREHMLRSADQAFMAPRLRAYSEKLEAERQERKRLAAENAERERIAAEKEAEHKRKEAEAKAKRDAELATRWTAPGEGLKMTEIEALTHRVRHHSSYDGGVDVDTTTWLLLKDGTAYFNPWIPPSDFDVEASRKVEPDRWDTWSKAGDGYSIGGLIAKPGSERHVDFNGLYIRTWGGLGYGGGFDERRMILSPNGRFYSSASNFMQAGGVVVSSSNSGNGRTSTASSTAAPHLLNSRKISKKEGADNRGTYAIDGYTIEFLTDSGLSRRRIYFRHGENSALIGGTHYTVDD